MKSSRNRKLALKGVLSKVFTLKFLKQHTCEWPARTSCLGFAIWHNVSHRDLRASSDYGPGTGNTVQVALEGRKAEVYSGFTGLVLSIVFLWENTQFGKVLEVFCSKIHNLEGFLVETKRMEWQIHSFGTEMKWNRNYRNPVWKNSKMIQPGDGKKIWTKMIQNEMIQAFRRRRKKI